jgi:glutamate dehydrogenase
VPAAVQMAAFYEVTQVVKRAVTWFLRFGGGHLKVAEEVSVFKPGIEMLKKHIEEIIPPSIADTLHKTEEKFIEKGTPKKIAEEIALLSLLSSANDIITISRRTGADTRAIAEAYFETGEKLGLDWLRRQAGHILPENDWQARVISGLTDDFYSHQAALTLSILRDVKKPAGKGSKRLKDTIDEWFDSHQETVGKIMEMINDLKMEQKVELEMLTLIGQRIGQLVNQAS